MLRNLFNSTLSFLETAAQPGHRKGDRKQGGPRISSREMKLKVHSFPQSRQGCTKCWSQRCFGVLHPQSDEVWREASAEAAPSPFRPRGAELGLAPTELRGRCRRVGGRREGLRCGYKGAAGAAWSLHSLESSSELSAISRPERTARRREQTLAQIKPDRGQGGGRRVQPPILDLFPSSGALLDPAAASSAEPLTRCRNKKFPRAGAASF